MRIGFLVVLLYLFSASDGAAQPVALSLRAGTMDASGRDVTAPAFYPELQLSMQLGTLAAKAVAVHGAAFAGYWSRDVGTQCRDCSRYAHENYVVGARMRFTAEKGGLPLTLSAGGARHMLVASYVSGSGIDGEPGDDFRRVSYAAELGLGLAVPLRDKLTLTGEGLGFLPLGSDENDPWNTARYALLFGVTYAL